MKRTKKQTANKLYIYSRNDVSANENYDLDENVNILQIQEIFKKYGNVNSMLVSNNIIQISITFQNNILLDLGVMTKPVVLPNTNLTIYTVPNVTIPKI